MAGLSDQEIELIAQHIVADLTDRGSAGAEERPAGPSLIGELGIFDSIDEAVQRRRCRVRPVRRDGPAEAQHDHRRHPQRDARARQRAGPGSPRGNRAGPLRRQGPQEPACHGKDARAPKTCNRRRLPATTASTSPSRRPTASSPPSRRRPTRPPRSSTTRSPCSPPATPLCSTFTPMPGASPATTSRSSTKPSWPPAGRGTSSPASPTRPSRARRR